MPQTEEHKYLDDVSRDLQDLIRSGKTITAIKLVRQETGLGLKEAKEHVDSIAARMGGPVSQRRGGCLSAFLAISVLATAAVFLVCKMTA